VGGMESLNSSVDSMIMIMRCCGIKRDYEHGSSAELNVRFCGRWNVAKTCESRLRKELFESGGTQCEVRDIRHKRVSAVCLYQRATET